MLNDTNFTTADDPLFTKYQAMRTERIAIETAARQAEAAAEAAKAKQRQDGREALATVVSRHKAEHEASGLSFHERMARRRNAVVDTMPKDSAWKSTVEKFAKR